MSEESARSRSDAKSTIDQAPTPDPEQDHRERRIWWTIFALSAVVFVGVLALGRPLVEGRLNAARNLDHASVLIADSKNDLEQVDAAVSSAAEVIAAQGQSATAEPTPGAIAVISAAESKLTQAEELSRTGFERLTQDEQERAILIEATATSRLAVLAAAEVVLGAGADDAATVTPAQALKDYRHAVEKMQQADEALVNL